MRCSHRRSFFFVALHIVAFVHVLMLKGTGISPLSSMSVAVAALILGKAVLIADMLPMINRFPNKPLIYNVAWKTLIYLLVATLIHYLEHLVDFWRQAGGLVAGNEKLLAPMDKQQFTLVPRVGYDPGSLFGSHCGMNVLFGKRRLRRAAGYGRKNSAIIAICGGSMRAGAWPIFGNSSSSARGPRWVISCATGVGRMSDFKPCSTRTGHRIRS